MQETRSLMEREGESFYTIMTNLLEQVERL